ncbi:MAG: 1-acyl-sn-glycerol-3-phosphate acyltransferase [Solirubrobacterales bacterium]|nr:1-acyl-sn-glycerol-3-phosphate acyltransferase [Solirubrobacterales bacterium]MBV9799624.1 1-acyl-sn-glycerol-3-phosphate acyltransferase [Solirubrobacterales bacterium]
MEIPDLPSEGSIDRLVSLLAPFLRICQPKLHGLSNLPADGSLLVGNHTIYGFLDLPFMMAEIWKRRRLAIRGLGEHARYAVPLWRDLLAIGGMVRGTRDNVRALMPARQTILVFPGARASSTSDAVSSTSCCGATASDSPGSRSSTATRSSRSQRWASMTCSMRSSTKTRRYTGSWPAPMKAHGVSDAAGRARGWTDTDPPTRSPVLLARRADRQRPLR